MVPQKNIVSSIFIVFALLLLPNPSRATNYNIFEEFDTLDSWTLLKFEDIVKWPRDTYLFSIALHDMTLADQFVTDKFSLPGMLVGYHKVPGSGKRRGLPALSGHAMLLAIAFGYSRPFEFLRDFFAGKFHDGKQPYVGGGFSLSRTKKIMIHPINSFKAGGLLTYGVIRAYYSAIEQSIPLTLMPSTRRTGTINPRVSGQRITDNTMMTLGGMQNFLAHLSWLTGRPLEIFFDDGFGFSRTIMPSSERFGQIFIPFTQSVVDKLNQHLASLNQMDRAAAFAGLSLSAYLEASGLEIVAGDFYHAVEAIQHTDIALETIKKRKQK